MKIFIDTDNITPHREQGALTVRNQILLTKDQQEQVEEAMGILSRGRLLPSQTMREVLLEVTRATLNKSQV